jgi:hypothetical protein
MHRFHSQLEALAHDRQAELRRTRTRAWTPKTTLLARPSR